MIEAVLAGFGVLWLAVEIFAFFSEQNAALLKQQFLPFLLLGLGYAVWKARPQLRLINRISGRDISIELRVADIFDLPGAIVVSTNTSFEVDTKSGLMSRDSIQGIFTSKYYDNEDHLAYDLQHQLEGTASEETTRGGKQIRRYPVGTVARVEAKGRTAYFLALTALNDHGNASATFEDLQKALPSLWEFVGSRGELGNLLVPILGSGRARIPQPRGVLTREIVQSFAAACASRRFCDSLTIVISPKDYRHHDVDLGELGAFVRHICLYTSFREATEIGTGTGIS